ncbi:MAG: hypothetical protein ACO1SX_17855 [Actinomycetota bacterium]
MRNSRHTVNGIQIASPCHMNWDEMEGDDRKRYCRGCRLHVFNISEMDVEEAAQLISDSTDRLCVRLYRRRDGTVLTQDCPVGLRAAIRRRATAFAGSLAMGVGVLASVLLRPGSRTMPTGTVEHAEALGSPAPVEPPPLQMGEVTGMIGTVPTVTPVARMGRVAAPARVRVKSHHPGE